jgi:predicted SAM-dependent methyltransferase
MKQWLNIGCGHDYREGWINLDCFDNSNIEVLADLEKPLPFGNETLDYVYASHVLEHITNVTRLIWEVHRVLKTGGIFEIYVPYGFTSSLFHVRYFFLDSMDAFVWRDYDLDKGFESRGLFRKIEQKITKFRVPGWWHLNQYYGIYIANLPLGRKAEIHWILERI